MQCWPPKDSCVLAGRLWSTHKLAYIQSKKTKGMAARWTAVAFGYWRKTSSRRRPRLPPPRCGRWQASSRTAWNSFLSGAFHVVGRKLKPPWDQLSTNSSSSQALEWAGNWADGCWLAQRGTAQQWPDLVLLRGRLGWKNRSHRWSSFPTAIIGQPMSSSHPPARSPAPERE
jgi:hypothetical protein